MSLAKDILDDIFQAIPKDGSNVKDEEDDNGYEIIEGSNSIPFENKVDELQKTMLKTSPVIAAKKIEPEVAAEVVVTKPEVTVITTSAVQTEDLLKIAIKNSLPDDPFANSVSEDLPPRVKKIELDEKAPLDVEEDKPIGDDDEAPVDINEQCWSHINNADVDPEWLTVSPSVKFNNFYREKRRMLKKLLVGGTLPLEALADELALCAVDINVGTHDFVAIHERMVEAYQQKERVKEILLQAYRQYFFWERMLPLFEGSLKRVDYDRGKQEGLVYEHLRDVAIYFEGLKKIVKSAEVVNKTLDSAFDCLSRQVTIALPTRDVERAIQPPTDASPTFHVSKSVSEPVRPVRPKADAKDLVGYDSLDDEPVSKLKALPVKAKKPTTEINWGDIG